MKCFLPVLSLRTSRSPLDFIKLHNIPKCACILFSSFYMSMPSLWCQWLDSNFPHILANISLLISNFYYHLICLHPHLIEYSIQLYNASKITYPFAFSPAKSHLIDHSRNAFPLIRPAPPVYFPTIL